MTGLMNNAVGVVKAESWSDVTFVTMRSANLASDLILAGMNLQPPQVCWCLLVSKCCCFLVVIFVTLLSVRRYCGHRHLWVCVCLCVRLSVRRAATARMWLSFERGLQARRPPAFSVHRAMTRAACHCPLSCDYRCIALVCVAKGMHCVRCCLVLWIVCVGFILLWLLMLIVWWHPACWSLLQQFLNVHFQGPGLIWSDCPKFSC